MFILALHWSGAHAASFDCRKAKSKSEILVCADPELSALDDKLGVLVENARRRAPDRQAFKRELVRTWIVRQRCKDTVCVKDWYERRIAEMTPAAPARAVATARTTASPKPDTPANVEAPVKAAAPEPAPAPAEVTAPVAVAAGAEKALPAAKSKMQALGRKLGFDVPLSKQDFLARFGSSGAECGAGKFRPLKELYGTAAVSECWNMTVCPSPSQDLKCGLVRVAFDARNRPVIFMTQLQAASTDVKAAAETIDSVVRIFRTLGGKASKVQKVEENATIQASGVEDGLTYQAMVVAPPTGSQFVIVSIFER